MTSETIDKLEEIIQFSGEILSYKVTRLTAPGENYGSLVLKVDISLKTSQIEEISLVAKAVPPNEQTQKLFNTEQTFRNEIVFYRNIIPILQNFQKQHGIVEVIDLFPKYYGSRLNLNCDETCVDLHGVLLLENLKISGYSNVPRTQGFDFATAKLVISDLAEFHAVSLTLRLKESKIFETKILPHLSPWKMNVEFHKKMKEKLKETVEKLPELLPLQDRILAGFDKKLKPSQCREPYATVIHNDFWCNNNMIKFEDGKPVRSKIVDFQECAFASLAKDVVFFLFSSVKIEVLENHYDNLVQTYYQKFTRILQELKCDLSNFSFNGFLSELDIEGEYSQFGHLVFMLYPIFGARRETECTPDDLLETEPTDLHKERLAYIVKEFARRNWI